MSNTVSTLSLQRILGIRHSTPLSLREMCLALKVTVCRAPELTPRLRRFTEELQSVLQKLDVTLLSDSEASDCDGRFKPGTVVLAPGFFPDNLLPINRVSTLYNNIIAGIYDEPPPLTEASLPQERLDAIVGKLAWDMVHILIFITESSWTICTMNGGVATFNTPLPEAEDVLHTLIPKLTAQVVPPKPEDFDFLPGTLDTGTEEFRAIADDFMECSSSWSLNPYLLTHTSREALPYRNGLYKKIVAKYLDQRSGMSYGFFARQRPQLTAPAVRAEELSPGVEDLSARSSIMIHGVEHVPVTLQKGLYLVPIPEVRVITTRSGCRKTAITHSHDLVEIGLKKAKAWLKTPAGLPPELVTRPSFDTLTILAHAAGNAMVASLLRTIRPDSSFPELLARFGSSMTHWHHYPENGEIPECYHVHGRQNPPVSCSTPQSAAYSLLGKIEALENALLSGIDYRGDVHIEPHHGTNMVGSLSLAETAELMNPCSAATTAVR
jgi:hypothetical protein